jgi:CRISPR-associated protein Cas1
MIKRTIFIENEVYCYLRDAQFILEYPTRTGLNSTERSVHVPIEDLGMVLFDHPQIRISMSLMAELFEANVAVVFCDRKHMPIGLAQAFSGNHVHQAIAEAQLNASEPLKKQLWQQTIISKICNQAAVIEGYTDKDAIAIQRFAKSVKSGDSDNMEGRAAKVYWKLLFPEKLKFNRDADGLPPNNALNYGYSILRSITARALVGSGLMPVLGLFHRNQYNPFCLADDIMEPYRVYVDLIVQKMVIDGFDLTDLSKESKFQLAQLSTCDVNIEGKKRPLMVAMQHTTASLNKCFLGKSRNIVYPQVD